MDIKSSNNIFVSKLDLRDRFVYIKLFWKETDDDLFRIQLFDDTTNSTWSGRFSHEFAANCRNIFEVEDDEEYLANVKLALTGQGSDTFLYDLMPDKNDPNTSIFRWKKKFEDAVMVHGSVPVHKDNTNVSKNELIDSLLDENKNLLIAMEECNKKREEISRDLEKCKNELQEFVTMKTALEESLYGKFVQLLNEKKKRIRLLEENLQSFE